MNWVDAMSKWVEVVVFKSLMFGFFSPRINLPRLWIYSRNTRSLPWSQGFQWTDGIVIKSRRPINPKSDGIVMIFDNDDISKAGVVNYGKYWWHSYDIWL